MFEKVNCRFLCGVWWWLLLLLLLTHRSSSPFIHQRLCADLIEFFMNANDCDGGEGKGEANKRMMTCNGELPPKPLKGFKARYVVILAARSD
jgi:hypothetical protein